MEKNILEFANEREFHMQISTEKSHRVLNDAKEARFLFNDNPIGVEFRHAVVLNITLVRAIGHVVAKENNGSAGIKVQNYFIENIKNEVIFKEFIETYRNEILKKYSSKINWASITDMDKNHRMEYIIDDGHFKGVDFRDLIDDSIEFWEHHLNQISIF